MKLIALVTLFLATSTFAFAGFNETPEIDANTAGSALALVSGGLLILRSRKK